MQPDAGFPGRDVGRDRRLGAEPAGRDQGRDAAYAAAAGIGHHRPDLRLGTMAEHEDTTSRRGAVVGEGDHVHPGARGQRRDGGDRFGEQRAQQQMRPLVQRPFRRPRRAGRRAPGVVGLERETPSRVVEHGHHRAVQHRPSELAVIARERQQDADDRPLAGGRPGRAGILRSNFWVGPGRAVRGAVGRGRRLAARRFRCGSRALRRRGRFDPGRRRSRIRHAGGEAQGGRNRDRTAQGGAAVRALCGSPASRGVDSPDRTHILSRDNWINYCFY